MEKSFLKRPLLIISCSISASSLLLMLIMPSLTVCLFLAAILVILALTCAIIFKINRHIANKLLTIILLGALISLSSYTINIPINRNRLSEYYGQHSLEGYITKIDYNSESGAACYITLTSVDGKKLNVNTYCTFEEQIPDSEYSILSFEGVVSDAESASIDFYNKQTLKANNIFLTVEADSAVKELSGKSGGIDMLFGKINRKICSLISELLNEKEAGLINALLFGDRSGLDASLSRDFRTLGITHMLVVSGMNIALIAGEAEAIMKLFRVKRNYRVILCVIICLLYMSLCGFTLSIVRASLMQIFCRISVLFKRRNDPMTSLFFSMAVIFTLSPGAVFDIGLALSFFATLGILNISLKDTYFLQNSQEQQESERASRQSGKLIGILKSLLDTLAAGLFACIFTLPLCCAYFGEISILGPFATCLFSFFLDVLLFLTPLLLVFSFMPILSGALIFIVHNLCSAVIFVIQKLSFPLQDCLISISSKLSVIIVCLLAACALFSLFAKKIKKRYRVIPAVVLWLTLCIYPMIFGSANGGAYFQSDNNEAIIINRDGYSTMIDISSGSKTFTRKVENALLTSLQNTNIDELLLTHLHGRHISQVKYLATNGYLKKVILPESADDDEKSIIDQIYTMSQKYGFKCEIYEHISNNETVISKGLEFEKAERYTSHNSSHPAIVFSLKVFEKEAIYLSTTQLPLSFLYPELSFEAESKLNIKNIRNADALIFGSHKPCDYSQNINFIFDENKQYIFSNKDIKSLITKLSAGTVAAQEQAYPIFIQEQ